MQKNSLKQANTSSHKNRFRHRTWHSNCGHNNLVGNSWQLIQPFLWRLNTTGTVSSTCGRWSVKKKLSQSAHPHIQSHRWQWKCGSVQQGLWKQTSVHLRQVIKDKLAFFVNEPKSKRCLRIITTLNNEEYTS